MGAVPWKKSLIGGLLALFLGYYFRSTPAIGSFLTDEQVQEYKAEGIVVVDNLLTNEELEHVTKELIKRVNERPDNMRPEDLLNLHFNDSFILDLARHPNFLSAATQLLNHPRLRVFSTRILCKYPGQSIEIPWHQDSSYWPLQPLKVASLWLAIDDVTIENGAMDMFSFSDLPASRDKNLGVLKGEEVGADFFIKVDTDDLPMEKMKTMTLKRGQAEFHDAFILHHSSENTFQKRRCAWIVRYIPDFVSIPPGSWRKMFNDDYQLLRLN